MTKRGRNEIHNIGNKRGIWDDEIMAYGLWIYGIACRRLENMFMFIYLGIDSL